MFIGIGTVFFFLGILVVGMLAMSAIAMKFTVDTATITSPEGANEEEIAAITAAIAQHRKTQSKLGT
jgi:sodium pump decarboxylase gamma subunit